MGRRLQSWRRAAFRRHSKRVTELDHGKVGDSSDSDDVVASSENSESEEDVAETAMMDGKDDVTSGEPGDGEVVNGLIKRPSLKEEPVVNTVKEAVLTDDCDRLKELLEEGSPIEDGLLYAVSSGNVSAVQTICNFLATQDALECYKSINAFAIGSEFLPSTTALQLASKENNYDIVKILIRYGAELPELRTCLLTPGVRGDRLVQCFAYLQYIKAMASPSLLVLTEINPVGRALRIAVDLREYRLTGKKITRTLQSHPSFTEQIDNTVDNIEELVRSLLDQCKSKREIEVFLNTPATLKRIPRIRKHKEDCTGTDLPVDLENAKILDFKKIMAHPFSQMVVTDRVFRGPVEWEEMSSLKFFLLSMMIIVFDPFLCLAYSFVPVKKLVQFMSTPYVRLLSNVSSSLLFLFFLLLTSLNVIYRSEECPEIIHEFADSDTYCSRVTPIFWPIYVRPVLTAIVVVGQIMWMISTIYKVGLWPLFSTSWSWVMLAQIILFMASCVLYWLSLNKVEPYHILTEEGLLILVNRQSDNVTVFFAIDEVLYQPSRASWDPFDFQILAELTFALGNILTAQRLLYTFIFFESLGPLIISISRMLKSVYRFAVLTFVILMSFSLGFAQLYAPYADIHQCDADEEDNIHCGNAEMFTSVRQSLHTLFWAIFGEFSIVDMELPSNLFMVKVTGEILHGIFIIMTSIIILNMLIAAMLTAYENIQVKYYITSPLMTAIIILNMFIAAACMLTAYENIQADVYSEFKFSRTKMLDQYCGDRSNVPPPYNLIPSVRVIWSAMKKLAAMTIKVLVRLGIQVPEQYKERAMQNLKCGVPQNEEAVLKQEEKVKERSQVMKTVVARYTHQHWKVTSTHRPSSNATSRRTSSVYNNPMFPGGPLGAFRSMYDFSSGQIVKSITPLEVITEDQPPSPPEQNGSNGGPAKRKQRPASVSLV